MTATPAPAQPSFAELVLAVDVPALARKIQQQGSRAAMGASTVEIVAMAVQITDLNPIVSDTFDLLVTADALHDERDPAAREVLRASVHKKIRAIAEALLALGYGQQSPTTTEKEQGNG